MRKRIAAAALLLAAACGCGTSETTPEEKVKAAVATFLASCAHERGVAAQEQVTPPARTRFVAAGTALEACGALLGVEARSRTTFEQAKVRAVDVGGGFASATLSVPDGAPAHLELESTRDTWLIAGAHD